MFEACWQELSHGAQSTAWSLVRNDGARVLSLVRDSERFRVVHMEPVSAGLWIGLLGVRYGERIRSGESGGDVRSLMEQHGDDGRCWVFLLQTGRGKRQWLPLATFLEDAEGDQHLLETAVAVSPQVAPVFLGALQLLVTRPVDFSRFDAHGDFLVPGGHNIVERHSTEKRTRHLSRRVQLDAARCTHCLQCATLCGEMKVQVGPQGARLLGPVQDHCTDCGLCRMRCPYLISVARQEEQLPISYRRVLLQRGVGIHLYGPEAEQWKEALHRLEREPSHQVPIRCTTVFCRDGDPSLFPAVRQTLFRIDPEESSRDSVLSRGLLMTEREEGTAPRLIFRSRTVAGILCATDSGRVERDLVGAAQGLGCEVRAAALPFVAEDEDEGENGRPGLERRLRFPSNHVVRGLIRAGLWDDRPMERLWEAGEVDMILAPSFDDVSAELGRAAIRETGRDALVMAPHVPERLPVTQSPLLNALARELRRIFPAHPELLEREARFARRLLSDVRRHASLIHARYRPLAFAGGHSACPSCAEAQVLAIPVTMALAMSLARGEIPQVAFTCETGCMSETLNKMNEVAQKVPGGRTVFGGGFAFGEAMASVWDRAVRMGLLRKGRRYVVSQGGDGGAVIGLPAWLNALRQQARLIPGRHANTLHFVTITDTQVYSNTGGESSATSMLGMGTLTTPIGRFLLGNQRIQWNLINLASEFPGVLVGLGHSAGRTTNQAFWHLADQLGMSAIRWDVTPCPETGKFFGEDPDDLARVMAQAGLLPEVVFFGRYRKRVAPLHPEDEDKPYDQWCRTPRPILDWISRDPRYKALLKKNPLTGEAEPRNITAHFLILQLETFRNQLNWEIDLETHLVRQAEGWVDGFLQELRREWESARAHPHGFPYGFLFNERGEWKPEFCHTLRRDLIVRVLGWDDLRRYVELRDATWDDSERRWRSVSRALEQLEAYEREALGDLEGSDRALTQAAARAKEALTAVQGAFQELREAVRRQMEKDWLGRELFGGAPDPSVRDVSQQRRRHLRRTLDRLLEERAVAVFHELQQHRLSQQLKKEFLESGGIVRAAHRTVSSPEREELRRRVAAFGPFSIAVASLAGDRGIAINRVFAQFLAAQGAWAGMAWQFGSSKRGTPVLSATFVDSRPLDRKDAMFAFPCAVLVNTNFEEMKRDPDLFFGQLRFGGTLIFNHTADPEKLWRELVGYYPEEIRQVVTALREQAWREGEWPRERLERALGEALSQIPSEGSLRDTCLAMVSCRVLSVDMDGLMERASGRSGLVSNLVAVGPIFQALEDGGFPLDWEKDRKLLIQGFPGAVLKNPRLLSHYETAMDLARRDYREFPSPVRDMSSTGMPSKTGGDGQKERCEADPGDSLMIMGGTLAGMVLSQIALPEHPLFYVGFPITPAGNPFYAMAEAFANGHPHIVVDENNPSEKVAAEKLLGVARTGCFLPVTCTASQGWRLFTEIIPQFVGARLEGIFVLAKRALAAPNLNIEESHTDFMSFRDDGGIMLAPKGIQEYVPSLYLARLLTHFAKLPVIVSIGGITDTHKIGLVRVPSDVQVRRWLRATLRGFDFLEDRIVNRQGRRVVHGPSCTAATYQETQSELEKAHGFVRSVWPHAVKAVEELTGVRLDPLEVRVAGGPDGALSQGALETLLILQGSLVPNAVEALQQLEEEGWRGLACVSVRLMNPFPEKELQALISRASRVVVLDRSNSFGSVPPLASRVFNAVARMAGGSSPKPLLRSLVGGLGGREITVEEMKAVLLSSHLLLTPSEPWEEELLSQWVESDPEIRDMVEELVALERRSIRRHTRVPRHLQPDRHGPVEQEQIRRALQEKIRKKDIVGLLAHYGQVEFVAPREVLGETELRRELVLCLERRLALEASQKGLKDWRRALLLALYGRPEDLHAARELMPRQGGLPCSAHLLRRHGLAEAALDRADGSGSTQVSGPGFHPSDRSDTPASSLDVCSLPSDGPSEGDEVPVFGVDESEAARIEALVKALVRDGESRPLFFNPEDYDHAVVEGLAKDPSSQLASLLEGVRKGSEGDPDTAEREWDERVQGYLWAYRDVIDHAVQREVLSRTYAPELIQLFEGDGLRRLESLAEELKQAPGVGDLCEALEGFLRERVFPGLPKSPEFYLEYFRTWVWPHLRAQGVRP
ncbi:Pyruvate:ferredoxin oxidoreductase [Desulfacinum hydrothermale DSM 13146]|uniref:Pyruvate:ferredoxin oxidoreductase n=1 Tax=Desulfacinum hydrothermale DSM 13146 TaxID=1121390 RepID=A0A1W1X1H9_9BACT|nr:hypothetical protein [Desulfacinum hydrothermale]SMC17765.1 Pyruvate:ferredoxin oxidoreductase [Desulfacinum hydrothermale DSM 13146]